MVSLGKVGGISEGDYNTWTLEWQRQVPGNDNNHYVSPVGFYSVIDERNNTIVSYWADKTGSTYITRFGIYNLSDGSIVFESPEDAQYLFHNPTIRIWDKDYGKIIDGMVYVHYSLGDAGDMSRSVQSYFLLLKSDGITVETWRSGASALWSRDFHGDIQAPLTQEWTNLMQFGISLTGKYILLMVFDNAAAVWPLYYWLLYKGS